MRTPEKKGITVFKVIYSAISMFLIVVACLIIIFYATHDYYPVKGTSMLPTMQDEGNATYINMTREIQYGDIIIIFNNEHIRIVKRVIGMSNDKVGFYLNPEDNCHYLARIEAGTDVVKIIPEPYLASQAINVYANNNLLTINASYKTFEDIEYEGQIIRFYVIPPDSIFVLGDNRGGSLDSSYYGALSNDLIIGAVDLVVNDNVFQSWEVLLYVLGLTKGTR